MKRALFATAAVLLAATVDAATINGTVADDHGQPLAAMTVAAYTTAGVLQSSGPTTAAGSYALTLPAGSYRVLAYDPAGAFATSFYADAESFDTSTTLVLTSAQSATNINFRLVPAAFAVGRVTGPNGAALPNITVAAYNLSGTRRGFTSTDGAGRFTLALPPGNFKIVAYDETLTYATTFFDGTASFETAATVTIAATTTLNLQLLLAAKLTGLVTDRVTFAPVSAARVTVYSADGSVSARTLTGSDGRYAVAVRPGALRIVVDDPTGNYATTFVPDAEAFSVQPPIAAAAGQAVTGNATMVRAGHLAGRVVDRISGAPLAAITVVAYNANGTTRSFATTDAAGAYSLVVPPGDYRLGTFDPALAYLPQFHPNGSSFGSAATVTAVAQQTAGGFDFALSKGARVVGHVTSRSLGKPLEAMTVGAYDLAGRAIASTKTDASGAYTLLLAPATVKVIAFDSALQFVTAYPLDVPTFDAEPPLPLVEGQSLTVDFAMADAGRISGIVLAAATFTPLPSINVIVYDASFRIIAETTTDAGGSFRVAVPSGSYLVAAADATYRYATAFYGGGSGVFLNVAAGQDAGPLQIPLSAAAVPPRRRALRR